MFKHCKFNITGRVQGVWYRGSMQQKARELGLCGFVKNLPDGSVYAEAEGDATLLDALADWCRRGPEGAKVERVEVSEGAWCGFDKFEVVR